MQKILSQVPIIISTSFYALDGVYQMNNDGSGISHNIFYF